VMLLLLVVAAAVVVLVLGRGVVLVSRAVWGGWGEDGSGERDDCESNCL